MQDGRPALQVVNGNGQPVAAHVSPDIKRGRRRLGGTGEDIIRDDDGQPLCIVTADVEADLDDDDVRAATTALWAAFRLARARRQRAAIRPA